MENIIQQGNFYYYNTIINNETLKIYLIIDNDSLIYLKFQGNEGSGTYEKLINLNEKDEEIPYNFNLFTTNSATLKYYLSVFEVLLQKIRNQFNLTIIN